MRTKYAILITVAIVIIVLVVIFWQDVKMWFKDNGTGGEDGGSGTGTTAPATFPLQQGSKGNEVKELQRYLNRQKAIWQAGGVIITNADLIIDGNFGQKTAAMCQAVQVVVPVTETFYNTMIKA
jgi:putative cell wall-binding protein